MMNMTHLTDADREAYVDLRGIGRKSTLGKEIVAGHRDYELRESLAILARHRTASTAALTAAIQRLRIFANGCASLSDLIIRKDGAHRVKVRGEWHDGPVADAYIALIDSIADGARAALSTPSNGDVVREALEDVAAERERQISAEGWTPDHDDQYASGQLSAAALSYVQSALGEIGKPAFQLVSPPSFWPWDACWWKPRGARRDLVRAAALIVAEIERLDRATLAKHGAEG